MPSVNPERIITSQRNGFRVTWSDIPKNEKSHLWWHWFFRIVQPIKVYSHIKKRKYVKSRTWVTTCRKCDYMRVQARELWLPGEEIK